MQTCSTAERLEQIERFAARAQSVVTVLILHFCTADRSSQLSDEQLVDVLELVEACLEQVRERAERVDAARGTPNTA